MKLPLYEAQAWAMIRAPVLPVECYIRLANPNHDGSAPSSIDAWADPIVSAAVTVGSLELANALERRSRTTRDVVKQKRKLLRYLIRMSTRPTPYGMFAGVALCNWGPSSSLMLDQMPVRTRTRPDMHWLFTLVMELERDPRIRRRLSWVANPGLVRAGRVFLAEKSPSADGRTAQPSVSVRATDAVMRVLSRARQPVHYVELEADLLQTPGATADKVGRLLDELWQQTLLVSDLWPPLTDPSPARWLVERLASIPEAHAIRDMLGAFLVQIRNWDLAPLADRAAGYKQLVTQAAKVHPITDNEPPLQVDTALSLKSNRLSELVAAEAERAAELLMRLTPSPRSGYLDAYRSAFITRYGTDREVRLIELVDPNFGLGLPTGHAWAAGGDARRTALRNTRLQELALEALRDRRLVVELDEASIAALALWEPDPVSVPCSLDLSLFLAAASLDAIDRGEFLMVVGPNLGGTAAGKNLGRFADLLEPDGARELRELTQLEGQRRPGPLPVELVYLPPRFRSANVALRPAVRDYEIVAGISPGVPRDHVVPLDELVVGVSAGRFYVRWPSVDREISPRSGHMLNYTQAPAALRFLEDVAQDGQAQISSFNWGPATGFPFLPRVQCGRAVLSLAQWRIDTQSRDRELCPPSSGAFTPNLKAWRARWNVPRHVYLSMGDNRLLLDLDDPDQAEELRAELVQLREGSLVFIQEALPGPNDAWLPGPNGHHLSELVFPLVVRTPAPAQQPLTTRSNGRSSEVATHLRLRPPGSDWLFVKLYCPQALEEDLIAGPIRTFCQSIVPTGLATSWFFIRYADPDRHIRIRFKGDNQAMLAHLLPQVCEWADGLIADGYCQRLAFDTYDREVERYGGMHGVELAEMIFAADSQACVDLLHAIRQGQLEFDRTVLAILSVDALLADLGLSKSARLDLYRKWAPATPENGRVYRQYQSILRPLLGDPDELTRHHGGSQLQAILRSRQTSLSAAATRLHQLTQNGELNQPAPTYLASCIHLLHNRLVGSNAPAEEVILGLLRRTRDGLDRGPLQARSPAAVSSSY